jgi:hypothetical protein
MIGSKLSIGSLSWKTRECFAYKHRKAMGKLKKFRNFNLGNLQKFDKKFPRNCKKSDFFV